MNIHFAGLLDGDKENYKVITQVIQDLGHSLVTNHYLKRNIKDIETESFKESKKFHDEFKSWMNKADVIIYDLTKSDVNAGYEVSFALSTNKPVIVIYEENVAVTPYVFKGIDTELFQLIEYSKKNLLICLKEAINIANQSLNVRFNLIISSKQYNFLEKSSQKRMISKSTIVRELINDEIIKKELSLKEDKNF